MVTGGGDLALGPPPGDPDEDWVVLIRPEQATLPLYLPLILLNAEGEGPPDEEPAPTCEAPFEETAGLVIVEAESRPAAGEWAEKTAIGGFTGDGYLEWTGSDRLNTPGSGQMDYRLKINTPGTYRFQWRSRIAVGTSSTDHNDSWLRFPDAAAFYGQQGDSLVYPKGSGLTPHPNGAGAGGWFKIYLNQSNQWSWQARTSDNDAHDIYVAFDTAGVYTMQISGRSTGHAIDRMVLYQDSVSSDEATATDRPETICQE